MPRLQCLVGMAGLLTSIELSGVPQPSSGRTDMFKGVLRGAALCRILPKCGYRTVSEPGNLVTPVISGQPASLIKRVAPEQPFGELSVSCHEHTLPLTGPRPRAGQPSRRALTPPRSASTSRVRRRRKRGTPIALTFLSKGR
jgi:hypothetical protein